MGPGRETEGATKPSMRRLRIAEALALADEVSVLSGRPGHVLETVAVPFARPRGYETIREHPDYPALFKRLYTLLESQ